MNRMPSGRCISVESQQLSAHHYQIICIAIDFSAPFSITVYRQLQRAQQASYQVMKLVSVSYFRPD
ncbi:hypothetical protein [Snodgrassella gandavensis]|uniref:hypothetical protein n=1 Tax=Snodgrassella gandavensis TaxID=2946698 RepID=UPI001EF3FD00|nr:hypothetical protein [Snodgrassella gandavensis]